MVKSLKKIITKTTNTAPLEKTAELSSIVKTEEAPQNPPLEIERGREVILQKTKKFPTLPGIYKMLGKDQEILYIGKAKNLKSRVSSYTNLNEQSNRIRRMISNVYEVVFTVTKSESAAIFLEADLIRTFRPRYNVALKDSNPFVSICISKNHAFPRVNKYYGRFDNSIEDYCGPFSSVKSVNEALSNIYKIFKLRSCSDSFFANRKRPCLRYDMKLCSAPCVGKVSEIEYSKNVQHCRDFLAGKIQLVKHFLKNEMEISCNSLNYEQAAICRDALRKLEKISMIEKESTGNLKNADVIALFQQPILDSTTPYTTSKKNLQTCAHVLIIRNGVYLGGDNFFINHEAKYNTPEDNIEYFIQQYYLQVEVPDTILTNYSLPNLDTLQTALSEKYNKSVIIKTPSKGNGVRWLKIALENAAQSSIYESEKIVDFEEGFSQIAQIFALPKIPESIEIYDNSHLFGKNAYGCMVVAKKNGFDKKSYKKFAFNKPISESSTVEEDLSTTTITKVDSLSAISSSTSGDDFAMMEEMITRRFKAADASNLPDLLLIDGGAGQVSSVLKVLEKYGLYIPIIGIAKGPKRNAGLERFFMPGFAPMSLPENSPVLLFLQRLRDEAHRFAIGTHRKSRSKEVTKSELNKIPGIGSKRKKSLLLAFGSVKGIQQATLEELQKVSGINKAEAKIIYNYWHANNEQS